MTSLHTFLLNRWSGRVTWLVCLISLCWPSNPVAAAPIDEFRISDMEQRIRQLESTVREQARQIAQLVGQNPTVKTAETASRASNSGGNGEPRWLKASSWSRLKLGMQELQVIEILGMPTQIRVSDDQQTRSLLYALEIGRSGFLSGKVVTVAGQITAIDNPTLK
jgi:hypothetical protein